MNISSTHRLPGFFPLIALAALLTLQACEGEPPSPEPPPVRDLTISKEDGLDSPVKPGEAIVYRLTYANVGDTAATGLSITETVPAGTSFDASRSDTTWTCTAAAAGSTCTFALDSLADGGSGAVAFAVVVEDPYGEDLEAIVNEAAIHDGGPDDPTPDNNSATARTPVAPEPELPPRPVIPAIFCEGCTNALERGWIDPALVDDYRSQCTLCEGTAPHVQPEN